MTDVLNIDWYSRNSQRNYPILSSASRLDVTETKPLPTDLIVDFSLTVPSNYIPTDFYIKYIDLYTTGILITIAYQDSILTVIDATSFPQVYTFKTDTIFGALAVFSDVNSRQDLGGGRWEFPLESTRFEPSTINFSSTGVSSFQIKTPTTTSEPLTGDIVLQAGTSVVVEQVGNTITLHSYDTTGFQEIEAPGGNRSLVTTINGIAPKNGNLNIESSECVNLQATGDGLKLFNPCTEPLCGAPEYETLLDAVKVIQREHNALNALATTLQEQLGLFRDVVIASKVGDIKPE